MMSSVEETFFEMSRSYLSIRDQQKMQLMVNELQYHQNVPYCVQIQLMVYNMYLREKKWIDDMNMDLKMYNECGLNRSIIWLGRQRHRFETMLEMSQKYTIQWLYPQQAYLIETGVRMAIMQIDNIILQMEEELWNTHLYPTREPEWVYVDNKI
jgi:hypothetical protein